MTERRTIRRAAEEAISDPRLGLPARFVPEETQSDHLPPGFAGKPPRGVFAEPESVERADDFRAHPMSSRPTSTQLMFRKRPTPWYRTRAALVVVTVVAFIAAITSMVVLLWPASSPEPTDSGPATSQPPEPSATLTPSAVPRASLAPPAAPKVVLPPPPPPPPPAESTPAPAPAAPPRYNAPRYSEPPASKPEIGVTRAPISVAPTVKPPAGRTAPKPGETSRRDRGFF